MTRFLRSITAAAAVAFTLAGLTAVDIAHGTVSAVSAQSDAPAAGAPPAGPQRGRRFGQMLLALNLTDAQKTQIRQIVAAARQQNQSVTDPQVKRSTMRAAYAKVQTVLTPAQRAKLQSEMAAARAQRQSTDHS
jgi:Spy/CpxP family protein refolding chaperone